MSQPGHSSHVTQPFAMVVALLGGIGVLLLFAAAYYGQFYNNVTSSFGNAPEDVVGEFSTRLKSVSLLASPEDVARQMDEHYAPFVLPQTLTAWKADPMRAPGRLTSSPWPDRFELATSTEVSETEYRVEGSVIEATSDNERASDYAVIAVVVEQNGTWKIRSFERTASIEASPDAPPMLPATTGTYVCLPHRDQSGPHTLECAFGIRTDEGVYYALDFSAFTTEEGMTIATGERIRVEGAMIPLSALGTDDRARIYDIQGMIRVASLTRM